MGHFNKGSCCRGNVYGYQSIFVGVGFIAILHFPVLNQLTNTNLFTKLTITVIEKRRISINKALPRNDLNITNSTILMFTIIINAITLYLKFNLQKSVEYLNQFMPWFITENSLRLMLFYGFILLYVCVSNCLRDRSLHK